jgi:hypothetical protein
LRFVAIGIFAGMLSLVLQLVPRSALAQPPEVVSQFPEEGAVLAEEPAFLPATTTTPEEPIPAVARYGLQLCFAEPVDVRDSDKGGLHEFTVRGPSGTQLAMRVVFQPDGFGVTVFPGLAPEPAEGQWTFDWLVRDADSLEEASGTIHFEIAQGGSPVPTESLPSCAGAPESQQSPPAGTTPADQITPGATATLGPAENAEEDNGGLSTGAIVGIVAGAVGGLVLVSAAAVYFKQRGTRG